MLNTLDSTSNAKATITRALMENPPGGEKEVSRHRKVREKKKKNSKVRRIWTKYGA
jgi:hypothetical protein